MARILIIGLAGYNLGDEAIALAAASALYPANDIVISTVKSGALSKYGIPEFFLNRRSVISVFNLIKNISDSDVILIGGGSLIQDKLGVGVFGGVLGFFLQVVFLSKLFGKKVLTLPIGVDELTTRLGKCYAKFALSMLNELHVRDVQSAKLAIKYAKKEINIKVAADPALLLSKSTMKIKRKRIVISLVKENLVIHDLIVSSKTLCEKLIEIGYEVSLLVMDARPGDEIEIYRKIVSEDSGISIIEPKDVYEVMSLLAESEGLIAMRLHAMILGLRLLPIIGISRTTKTESFCQNHKIPYFKVDEKWVDLVIDSLKTALSNNEFCLNQQMVVADTQAQKAGAYFNYIAGIAKEFDSTVIENS